jgi:hypothetical protein
MRLGGTWAFWIKLALGAALVVLLYLLVTKGWAALKGAVAGAFGWAGAAASSVGSAVAGAGRAVASVVPGLHEPGPAELAAKGVTPEGAFLEELASPPAQPLGRLSQGEFQTTLTPADYADLSNPYAYP